MKRKQQSATTKARKFRAERRVEFLKNEAFEADLSAIINRHSMENGSNTPDFILAKYLRYCLEAFNDTSLAREGWYGRSLSIGGDE